MNPCQLRMFAIKASLRGHVRGRRLFRDVGQIAAMFRFLRFDNRAAADGLDGAPSVYGEWPHYTCTNLDAQTGDCNVYEYRPAMCREYPYRDSPCPYVGCTSSCSGSRPPGWVPYGVGGEVPVAVEVPADDGPVQKGAG